MNSKPENIVRFFGVSLTKSKEQRVKKNEQRQKNKDEVRPITGQTAKLINHPSDR